MRAGTTVVGFACLAFAITSAAMAGVPYSCQYGLGPWAYYPAGGYGYPVSSYGGERLPFYTLYPPVYYSHVVPRPFGYSPFAYPPAVLTPDPNLNPIGGHPAGAAGQPSRPPLRIVNPFVVNAEMVPVPEPLAPAEPRSK
jgi:hypothetical protein